MKNSGIFWGLIFVAIGALLLLGNFGFVTINWMTIANLWPIILIFWGISWLFSGLKYGWILTLFFTLVLVFCVFAMALGSNFSEMMNRYSASNITTQSLLAESSAVVTNADFSINTGAGVITLDDTTSKLIDASISSNIGSYALTENIANNKETVALKMNSVASNTWFLGQSIKNTVQLKLNPAVIWDNFNVIAGASKIDLDLSKYLVENTSISAGASTIVLRFSDFANLANVNVSAGASKITIEVPKSVGCNVIIDSGLSSKTLSGFSKIDEKTYQSEDYASQTKKINLNINAGASTINVSRY